MYKYLVKSYRVLPIRPRTDKINVELNNLNTGGSTADKLVSRPKKRKVHSWSRKVLDGRASPISLKCCWG